MAVFNKKNALIGWAVLEAARLFTGRGESRAAAEEKKPRRAGKALAAATGAVMAVGGVAALRRRRSGQGTEE
jgi:hypothetical protein